MSVITPTNKPSKIAIFILIFFITSLSIWFYIIIADSRCFYGTKSIKASELLIVISQEKNINYCDMLRQSFVDDKIFAQFISLKFYDGSGIDHANVVYQLYQYYGSETFWQKAKSLNHDDKQWVENYLEYAMSENKYRNK